MNRMRAGALAALALTALVTTRALGDHAEEAARVRILLVVDTNALDAKIQGFAFDKDAMKRVIKEALRDQNLEDRYTLDVLHGADAAPAKVLDYYRNLKVEPDEALLCYYSGHGGTDRAKGHFLAMKAGNLDRDELRKAMATRRPRLMVLLTDCCADFGGASPFDGPPPLPPSGIAFDGPGGGPPPLDDDPFGEPPPFAKGPPAKKEARPVTVKVTRDGGRQNSLRNGRGEILKDLLFRQRGVIDITASTAGHLAFSSRMRSGGLFTLTLTGLLSAHADRFEALGDGAISWGSFFDMLQSMTKQNASREAYQQLPQAFSIRINGGRR